jgi:hypothetical protein
VYQQSLEIYERNSELADVGNLIVSVRYINVDNHCCEITVGSPGLPNVVKTMYTGDAVLFETPTHGILEVRMMAHNSVKVDFLVSQVSPHLGIAGGVISDDPSNIAFTQEEIHQIADSINKVQDELAKSGNYSSEQLELINRKLGEIQDASNRLGRKDWINYVAGSITGLCISAAFSPDTTKDLFKSINGAFSWLFNNALQLLS